MGFVGYNALNGCAKVFLGDHCKTLYASSLMLRVLNANEVEYNEDLLKEIEEHKLMQFENILSELNAGHWGLGVFVVKEGSPKYRGTCYKVTFPWEIKELLWGERGVELLESGVTYLTEFNCGQKFIDDLDFVTEDASGKRSHAIVRRIKCYNELSSFDVLYEGDAFPYYLWSMENLGKEVLKLFENYNASDLPW